MRNVQASPDKILSRVNPRINWVFLQGSIYAAAAVFLIDQTVYQTGLAWSGLVWSDKGFKWSRPSRPFVFRLRRSELLFEFGPDRLDSLNNFSIWPRQSDQPFECSPDGTIPSEQLI